MASKICIFCLRTDEKAEFSREHIIPRSIGGRLCLDDFVCADCNSWLGSNVDSEVLRLPEVIGAFDALGLEHDRSGIFDKYYEVTGELDGLVLRGRLTPMGAEFPPQELKDGSLLVPESDLEDTLSRSVLREIPLGDEALTIEAAKAELQKVVQASRSAKPGEEVRSTKLGRTLIKRSGSIEADVRPRRKARLNPLAAKITYEYLFFLFGKQLFVPQNAQFCNSLLDTIESKQPSSSSVIRLAAPGPGYEPRHVINFRCDSSLSRVQIVFFGSVNFIVIGPSLASANLDYLRETFGATTVGIQFQQRVDVGAKAFWAVREPGPGTRIR